VFSSSFKYVLCKTSHVDVFVELERHDDSEMSQAEHSLHSADPGAENLSDSHGIQTVAALVE